MCIFMQIRAFVRITAGHCHIHRDLDVASEALLTVKNHDRRP
jgi:hypothetical protein